MPPIITRTSSAVDNGTSYKANAKIMVRMPWAAFQMAQIRSMKRAKSYSAVTEIVAVASASAVNSTPASALTSTSTKVSSLINFKLTYFTLYKKH